MRGFKSKDNSHSIGLLQRGGRGCAHKQYQSDVNSRDPSQAISTNGTGRQREPSKRPLRSQAARNSKRGYPVNIPQHSGAQGEAHKPSKRVHFAHGPLESTPDGHPLHEGCTAKPSDTNYAIKHASILTKRDVARIEEVLDSPEYAPSVLSLKRRVGLDSSQRTQRPLHAEDLAVSGSSSRIFSR